jgi:hypothetical protein
MRDWVVDCRLAEALSDSEQGACLAYRLAELISGWVLVAWLDYLPVVEPALVLV